MYRENDKTVSGPPACVAESYVTSEQGCDGLFSGQFSRFADASAAFLPVANNVVDKLPRYEKGGFCSVAPLPDGQADRPRAVAAGQACAQRYACDLHPNYESKERSSVALHPCLMGRRICLMGRRTCLMGRRTCLMGRRVPNVGLCCSVMLYARRQSSPINGLSCVVLRPRRSP